LAAAEAAGAAALLVVAAALEGGGGMEEGKLFCLGGLVRAACARGLEDSRVETADLHFFTTAGEGKERRDLKVARTTFLTSASDSEDRVDTQREEREAASSTLRVDLGVSESGS